MAKSETEIKNLVESAIRSLHCPEWSPLNGGEWKAANGARVIIQKPTQYCIKASYRVVHPLLGAWAGYLNGLTGHKIGAPRNYMTQAQVAKSCIHQGFLAN